MHDAEREPMSSHRLHVAVRRALVFLLGKVPGLRREALPLKPADVRQECVEGASLLLRLLLVAHAQRERLAHVVGHLPCLLVSYFAPAGPVRPRLLSCQVDQHVVLLVGEVLDDLVGAEAPRHPLVELVRPVARRALVVEAFDASRHLGLRLIAPCRPPRP